MKKISDYTDEYGAICHLYPPGLGEKYERGDSARETGTYVVATEENIFAPFMYAFSVPFTGTALCRHNFSKEMWHRDPKEFSRDQWTGIMCALVIKNDLNLINLMWSEQKKHHGRSQNKDIITWEYALYIRAYRKHFLYPILCLFDLGLLVNAIIRSIKNKRDKEDTGDDINVTTMLYVALKVMPTPVSFLARVLYRALHPGIQQAWDSYYRHDLNPPINEVWRNIIKEYFV